MASPCHGQVPAMVSSTREIFAGIQIIRFCGPYSGLLLQNIWRPARRPVRSLSVSWEESKAGAAGRAGGVGRWEGPLSITVVGAALREIDRHAGQRMVSTGGPGGPGLDRRGRRRGGAVRSGEGQHSSSRAGGILPLLLPP